MGARDIRRAMRRPATTPTADRAGFDILGRASAPLTEQLAALIGEDQVLGSPLDLVRYACDASPYRLLPKVVVKARDGHDVAAVLRFARHHGHSVTFRAAGTSLNGQAQGDDILVDVREHFGGVQVLDDGLRVATGPGVIVARANAHLAPHRRRLGPDPASSAAATVGGVFANNASGMTTGVRFNSYRTIDAITAVLPSGTTVDTADPDAAARLATDEPDLVRELIAIRDELRADTDLADRIRFKFRIKNTTGYRLDAFLDADEPIDILRLLLVGSEGTLGFVSHLIWHTVPLGSLHTTAFLRFASLRDAAASVPGFNAAGADAVELMDAASLRGAAGVKGAPRWLTDLGPDADDAVILTELRADDPDDLDAFERRCAAMLADAQPGGLRPEGGFTRDAAVSNGYWAVRKGMLATVGASRPAGTVLITEDVCIGPERLAEAVGDLQQLLVDHGFTGAVNGHASAGNLHFYLYLDSTDADQVAQYRAFMTSLVTLVCDRYDGSLKGEHGTGRNMAPFVEREWGSRAYELMWRVKRAFDPSGVLGPDVVMSRDPDVAFTHLKSMPAVDVALDACIECGFCEPVCPSRHLTTTPRQRIALQRELARQGWSGPLQTELVDDYEYAAVNTCAGDSSCAIACPVDIDTGHAMKQLRQQAWSPRADRVGSLTARRFDAMEKVARSALRAAAAVTPVLGQRGMRAVTDGLRQVVDPDLMPGWLEELPGPAPALPPTSREGADAVYFAACINRIFGPSANAADPVSVPQALVALAGRAGRGLWIPDDLAGTCCATIWQSKGLTTGNREMAGRLVDDLWRWTDGGTLPVVVDASSCTLGILHEVVPHLDDLRRQRHGKLAVVDALTWTVEQIVPRLPEHPTVARIVAHVTCSMQQLGIADDLLTVANEAADDVVVPVTDTCCGFAGDRGFLHPELTESATRDQAAEVVAVHADAHVSGNRTCEIGLEHATGAPYESAIVTLERLTRQN